MYRRPQLDTKHVKTVWWCFPCEGVNKEYANYVRFQVLTAASMMFRIVFWDVLPCKTIVDRFQRYVLPSSSRMSDGGMYL
jgi:hypothetical protein